MTNLARVNTIEAATIFPTKLIFVIDLKSAKALALNMPPTVSAIADQVIE